MTIMLHHKSTALGRDFIFPSAKAQGILDFGPTQSLHSNLGPAPSHHRTDIFIHITETARIISRKEEQNEEVEMKANKKSYLF